MSCLDVKDFVLPGRRLAEPSSGSGWNARGVSGYAQSGGSKFAVRPVAMMNVLHNTEVTIERA
jgi:hypothetical protein